MKKILVSIIIPIYNVGSYIKACLQSVVSQTQTEGLECILIDDCGTDNSMQIAQDFVDKYNGSILFSIYHHSINQGLSAARNTGIRAAKGEYVYFLDSDDQIVDDCMEQFFCIIGEHPSVDLVQGLLNQDSPYMNQFRTKKLPKYTNNQKYIKRALLDYDELPVCAANKMVHRQLIIEHDLFFKEGIIHEDNYWSFFLAKYVRSLAVYKKPCYLYTVNDTSITKNINFKKEVVSYHTMITDFCANVDDNQKGVQRLCIYLLLEKVRRSGYYDSFDDYKALYCKFKDVCNPIERLFLRMWNQASISSPQYKRAGNILQHLFKL